MRPNVPSLPPYWADEPAMFTDEDGINRRRVWQRHRLPSGRLARIALAAYRPDPDLPDEERQPRPGHQGRWLLGIYIVSPADDIAARAAVMVWRRPDQRFYVGDAGFAEFGVAAEAALDSEEEAPRPQRA
jgi:hypothetical protein